MSSPIHRFFDREALIDGGSVRFTFDDWQEAAEALDAALDALHEAYRPAARREVLPDRRPNETVNTEWEAFEIAVTVGYDPATGDPREVFANTPSGGAFASCIADSCVLISLALQHGIAPATLARSLGRVPVWIIRDGQSVESTGPASPIGAILGVLLASAHPEDSTP